MAGTDNAGLQMAGADGASLVSGSDNTANVCDTAGKGDDGAVAGNAPSSTGTSATAAPATLSAVSGAIAALTISDATREATANQLSADEESSSLLDDGKHTLPFITRLYGGLVMLLGVCTIPLIIYELTYGIRQVLDGKVTIDALALPFILSCVEVVVLIALSLIHI